MDDAKRRVRALSAQVVNADAAPSSSSLSTASASASSSSNAADSIPPIRQLACPTTDPRVRGKVAIVTGADSPLGIGRATAHQLAQNGARAVYICDIANRYLDTHVKELKSLFPSVDVHTRQFDAADPNAVREVVDEALQRYGRLDIMFANAGVNGTMAHFAGIDADAFVRTLRTNVLSVFLAIKEATRAMQVTGWEKTHPGGSIVATASVAGLRSNAGPSDYSASKAAVINLVQTTAFQLAGTGVRVNAVLPGIVETGMTIEMYDLARKRGTENKIGQLNPTKRGGLPDEVARVVLFLASDDASYVNGQSWAVDGGLSAGLPFVPGKLA